MRLNDFDTAAIMLAPRLLRFILLPISRRVKENSISDLRKRGQAKKRPSLLLEALGVSEDASFVETDQESW